MTATATEELKEVPMEQVVVNPYQPRRLFAEEELKELAQSIREVGLIHPPAVWERQDGFFELISGERRFRAAQLAGMKNLLVLVRESGPAFSAQAALIENVQRVDLNGIEVAKALKSLIDRFGLHQDELAQRIGKKRSTIANYLRLLGLPKNIQDAVSANVITMGHAKAILAVPGFEKQNLLYERIVKEEFSVRQAEQAASHLAQKESKPKTHLDSRDVHLREIEERLQHQLGTKVTIQGSGKTGKICIDYYSLDDLDRLLALFGE